MVIIKIKEDSVDIHGVLKINELAMVLNIIAIFKEE